MKFNCICGEDTWDVELSQPTGAGGTWHIMVDKFYFGQMWKRNGKWEGYINGKTGLTFTDILILGDIIDGGLGE